MDTPRYTLEKINPLPEFDRVQAYGLNNQGHVVGDSYTLLATHGKGQILASGAYLLTPTG